MRSALILVAAMSLSASAFAQEISFDDVPPAIMEVALETAPGVDFYKVSIEMENGVAIYEFEATDHEGKHVEVDVTENGDLEEIEMETTLEDTPAAVLAVLEEAAPGFEITYIELSVRDGGAAFVYEFEGLLDGRQMDVEIDEGGEVLAMSHRLQS